VLTAVTLAGCALRGGTPLTSKSAKGEGAVDESAVTAAAVDVAPSPRSSAPPRPADEDKDGPDRRINRLVRVAKVWAAVRWFHPYLFHRSIDWDRALVDALPRINAAESADEYEAAVGGMLAILRDPLTRVAREQEFVDPPAETPQAMSNGSPEKPLFDERDGVLFVTAPSEPLTEKDVETVRAALLRAKTAVFDLRATSPRASGPMLRFLEIVASVLSSRACRAPGARHVVHQGFPGQIGRRSAMYSTTFVEVPGESFVPPRDGVPKRVAFLVNKVSPLAPIVLALQRAGDGVIVSEGPLSEENMPGNQIAFPLGEGRYALMRKSELTSREPLRADVELPLARRPGAADRARKAALAALKKNRAVPRLASGAVDEPIVPRDDAYENMRYPAVEYRLLALFRAWAVIRWFYPYLPLLDGNWDATFREFIPKLEAARDATDYGLALSEFAAQIPDAHVAVFGSAELDKWFGEAYPPTFIRMIEGQPVVAALLDPSAAQAGVAVGDVIAEVDGVPVRTRMDRYGKYLAASNASQRDAKAVRALGAGARGSVAEFVLQSASGQIKRCKLLRDRSSPWNVPRSGEIVQMVAEGIGYVDLARLERADVDAMFDKLRATRAIIFDMRGYPEGTAWVIAPRLGSKRPAQLATYYLPAVTAETTRGRIESIHSIEAPLPDGRWKYAGRTVMLIDESTVSQAEHTGLFFEAAAGTKFIGSQTAGANGDVTAAVLPGGLHFTFSGLDVRHADGRQLQRIGLIPDVEVKPTIAGIRAGRDEVLERAIQYLTP
jgi:C-terminal processing protease CtpA/Prc